MLSLSWTLRRSSTGDCLRTLWRPPLLLGTCAPVSDLVLLWPGRWARGLTPSCTSDTVLPCLFGLLGVLRGVCWPPPSLAQLLGLLSRPRGLLPVSSGPASFLLLLLLTPCCPSPMGSPAVCPGERRGERCPLGPPWPPGSPNVGVGERRGGLTVWGGPGRGGGW